jgi:hypothetical protein
MKTPISLLAARESAGGAWPGGYLPVNSPWASGDQTIWEMPLAAHSGKTSTSGARQSIEYWGLGRDEQIGARHVKRRLDLLRRPFAEAEAARLSRGDNLLERFDRLFDRHVGVKAVCLVEVDVVGL